jgi:hypothetical protein
MRKLLLCVVLGAVFGGVPAAAASPTVRLTIIHVLRGCHVWGTADGRPLGASRTITVTRGTRLQIRDNCPMAFDVVQIAGPKLALGPKRWQPGTSHTLVFLIRGVFKLRAHNVQSSEVMGLATLGPDNTPVLTIRVR